MRTVPTLLLFLCCTMAAAAQDPDVGDVTQVSGTLKFTCTPDEKSKQAGATPFEDTLELGDDRVKSKALSAQGFPAALSIPKTVNGVPTLSASFKKPGASATYFIRIRKDNTVHGSLTRTQAGKTLRYTIGAPGGRDNAKPATRTSDITLDPDVLRVNGGFVRLMSVQVALADAGVTADKTRVAEVLKAAGQDQHALRAELLGRKITPEQYVKLAEARLNDAHQKLAGLLGANASKVESAYDKPFAAGYVYLNQMRAAAAEANTGPESSDAAKRADQAIYKSLKELTTLAKKPDALTKDAAERIKDRTLAEVSAALPQDQRDRFEKILDGLTSYSK